MSDASKYKTVKGIYKTVTVAYKTARGTYKTVKGTYKAVKRRKLVEAGAEGGAPREVADGVERPVVHRVCATTAHSENSRTESCTERYSSQFKNN